MEAQYGAKKDSLSAESGVGAKSFIWRQRQPSCEPSFSSYLTRPESPTSGASVAPSGAAG